MASGGQDRLTVLEEQQRKMMTILECMQTLSNENLKPLEIPRVSEWELIVQKIGDNKRITIEEFATLRKLTKLKAYMKIEAAIRMSQKISQASV